MNNILKVAFVKQQQKVLMKDVVGTQFVVKKVIRILLLTKIQK